MSLVQFWKEIVITQICSGSVSLFASAAIVTFVALNGLSNPYRRILFGLSISDILQSFGIVVGPLLAPSDVPQALWAIGNRYSCRFVGFLFMIGSSAVPMYTLFLSIYYVCKVRGKMTDAQFAHKVEKKLHAIIILINLSFALAALFMDTFNAGPFGNMCITSSWPTGCRQNPEVFGECDPVIYQSAAFFLFLSNIFYPVVCLGGILFCLGIIFWNVVITERISGPANVHSADRTQSESDQTGEEIQETRLRTTSQQRTSAHGTNNVVAAAARGDLRAVARQYKTELVTQSCCYVLVFLLSTMPFLLANIIYMSGTKPSRNYLRASALLYPLGGFFNIIVYTRMNVQSFHRRHPECPIIQAFWLVLKHGGEIPSDRYWNESMAWRICRCFQRPIIDDINKREHVAASDPNERQPQEYEQHRNYQDPERQDSLDSSGSSISSSSSSSSQDSSSLFPITHASIKHQESVSDLQIRMRSRPVITESLPDSAQGMREGMPTVMSNDLKGFSGFQAFESKNLKGSDDIQHQESTDSSMKEELERIISNDLSGFSNIQSLELSDARSTSQNHENDAKIISMPTMRNIQKTDSKPRIGMTYRPGITPSEEDPAHGTTGMSHTFDERNAAHRQSDNWNYAQGDESGQNLETNEIIVSGSQDFSSNLSSIPQQQDNGGDQKYEDDFWAATFERVRRWRPSE